MKTKAVRALPLAMLSGSTTAFLSTPPPTILYSHGNAEAGSVDKVNSSDLSLDIVSRRIWACTWTTLTHLHTLQACPGEALFVVQGVHNLRVAIPLTPSTELELSSGSDVLSYEYVGYSTSRLEGKTPSEARPTHGRC